MDPLLHRINQLVEDKNQLVMEKADLLMSQHKMWQEFTVQLQEKDARIDGLMTALQERTGRLENFILRHSADTEQLRRDGDQKVRALDQTIRDVTSKYENELQVMRDKNKELARALNKWMYTGEDSEDPRRSAAHEDLDNRTTQTPSTVSEPEASLHGVLDADLQSCVLGSNHSA